MFQIHVLRSWRTNVTLVQVHTVLGYSLMEALLVGKCVKAHLVVKRMEAHLVVKRMEAHLVVKRMEAHLVTKHVEAHSVVKTVIQWLSVWKLIWWLKALLHLSRMNALSPLRTDPYTMNVHGCALIASTLAKCKCEEQRFMMLFMDCHVTVVN